MAAKTQHAAAEKPRARHAAGVLVLPNAWDAGSAAVIALAGAQAIATTSGGIAWSLGRADGQRLTRAEMTERVREIVAAVTIPVTADIEGGYGPGPADVAATVEAVIAAGAAGVNIEDSGAPGGPLFGLPSRPRESRPPGPRPHRPACPACSSTREPTCSYTASAPRRHG